MSQPDTPKTSRPDPAAEMVEKFFKFAHLPDRLASASEPFHKLANHLIDTLPPCAERTVAIRKLLEAKDCAVRSLL